MEQIKYDVFISYRRKGGSEKAQLVKSELKQRRVEDERIFLDTHSLHDGDFEQKIKVAIEQSQSIVVIFSKGCFDEIKETDFWYMEIREALLQGKKVIPIFFDGISSFASINVPQELAELTKKNAVTYQHEYADAAFDKLITFVGLQKEVHNPPPKRGCLFSLKYKGCILSVTIVALVCFALVPITKVSNNEGTIRIEKTSIEDEILKTNDNQTIKTDSIEKQLEMLRMILTQEEEEALRDKLEKIKRENGDTGKKMK